jgi:hypothetical protein
VIFDAEGRVAMVVHPTGNTRLEEPAFNPPACVQVRIAKAGYDALPAAENFAGLAHHHELLKALVSDVAAKDTAVAAKIEAKIAEVEAARASQPINEPEP